MFRRPWSPTGAAVSAGISIPILFGALLGRLSLLALIYYPGLVAYYFLTLDHVGRGRGGPPTTNLLEADTLFPNAWKGLACALAMSSPLIGAFIIAPEMVSARGARVAGCFSRAGAEARWRIRRSDQAWPPQKRGSVGPQTTASGSSQTPSLSQSERHLTSQLLPPAAPSVHVCVAWSQKNPTSQR